MNALIVTLNDKLDPKGLIRRKLSPVSSNTLFQCSSETRLHMLNISQSRTYYVIYAVYVRIEKYNGNKTTVFVMNSRTLWQHFLTISRVVHNVCVHRAQTEYLLFAIYIFITSKFKQTVRDILGIGSVELPRRLVILWENC
jgi:hypothetical protein